MPRVRRDVPYDRLVSKTLAEIAKELGYTAQAVRHVEKRALEKIRVELLKRRVVTNEGRYEQ